MKVSNSTSLGSAAAVRTGAPPPASGFALPGGLSAPEVAHASPALGMTGISSLDALLALQEVSSPLERRRKAVRRAGRILDVLDDIKVALLGGDLTPLALDRLLSAVREQREGADDPGLEAVLGEIETRAAVEIAKLEMARAAA
jgi:hypothetical protein